MTIENSGNFYGFKKAGNLDNTPISYPASPITEPILKNTRTKSSFGSTWMVLLLAAVLVVAFCFAIFRWNSSSDPILSVTKSNSGDLLKKSLPNNIQTAAESYMSENYRDYEYISSEQNEDNNFFLLSNKRRYRIFIHTHSHYIIM